MKSSSTTSRWLFLIHHLPPKPAYLRVKVWRRLQGLGAVALKNSVYVLPAGDEAQEDFEWLAQEVAKEGGEAVVCAAQLLDGLKDAEVEQLFRSSREPEYRELAKDARALVAASARKTVSAARREELRADSAKLRARLAEVVAIDFFAAPGREASEGLLAEVDSRLAEPAEATPSPPEASTPSVVRAGIWVTRRGIHVDRMASAWLIRRFIDVEAKFRFVDAKSYQHQAGELRFDMFEAEYTHEGDLCSFEVLVRRFQLAAPPLQPLAEMIHDIDLKDGKFGRAETAGFERAIAGIAMGHSDDEVRLARAAALLDDLYTAFERKGALPLPGGARRRADRPERARRSAKKERGQS